VSIIYIINLPINY